MTCSETFLEDYVLPFDIAQLAELLQEWQEYDGVGRIGSNGDETDTWDRALLLRPRCERPRSRRSAEQRDELAPLHSITSSARASSDGGTSRPSAFAVLRLVTNRTSSIARPADRPAWLH